MDRSHDNRTESCLLAHSGGVTRVIGPTDDLQWLREFCCPAFQLCSDGEADETITVIHDGAEYRARRDQALSVRSSEWDVFTLDGSFERLPGCRLSEDEVVVWAERFQVAMHVSHSSRCISLLAPSQGARVVQS